MKRLTSLLSRLAWARSGVAAVEFALILPFLMVAGISGTELTWYMLCNMQVNQVAVQLADNASRIGDTSTIDNRKIYEADINDMFFGANINGGKMLNLFQNGRVIISSLQVNPAGNNYIAWQRCKGLKVATSSYGVQGDVKTAGMGPTGEEVLSPSDTDAVTFVEIVYDYQPLISKTFASNKTIRAISSFMVRDKRDLSQIYQLNPAATVSSCSLYTSS